MTDRSGSPPSGGVARVLTLASPVLPILLPLAIYFQHRARRETDLDPSFSWSTGWINRPLVFTVTVWAVFLLVAFLLFGISAALGVEMA